MILQGSLADNQMSQKPDPNCLTVSLDPGTKEAGTTYSIDNLIKDYYNTTTALLYLYTT